MRSKVQEKNKIKGKIPIGSLAISEKYFSGNSADIFLPTMIDIYILELLTTKHPDRPLYIAELSKDMGISEKQLMDFINNLLSAQMVDINDGAKNLDIVLLPNGKSFYDNLIVAERESTLECVKQIKTLFSCEDEKAQGILHEFDSFLKQKSSKELVSLITNDNESVEVQDEKLQKIISEVQEKKTQSPIYLRTLSYLISSYGLEILYKNKVKGKLRVIIDTNVLLRLVTGKKLPDAYKEMLSSLLKDKENSEIEFLIADVTLKEFSNVLRWHEHNFNAFTLGSILGLDQQVQRVLEIVKRRKGIDTKSGEIRNFLKLLEKEHADESANESRSIKQYINQMGSLGVDFFLDESSPTTFRDYCAIKMQQVLGSYPLHDIEHEWKPHFFQTGINPSKVRKVLSVLRNKGWKERRRLIEEHDIELVLYADKMNRNTEVDKYVIWTNHSQLSNLANLIGVSRHVVTFGPKLDVSINISPDLIKKHLHCLFLHKNQMELEQEALKDLHHALKRGGEAIETPSFYDIMSRLWNLLVGYRQTNKFTEEDESKEEDDEYSVEFTGEIPLSFVQIEDDEGLLEKAGWIDLSMEWGKSPDGSGATPLQVYWRERNRPWKNKTMMWHISPHTITHMDLPWALDELPLHVHQKDERVHRHTKKAQDYLAALASPQLMRAVFVKFTDLGGLVQKRLGDTNTNIENLFKLSGTELADLVMALRINPKTLLVERIPNSIDLKDTLLILHTGWAQRFIEKKEELCSSFWQAGHPWLLHPWLDEEAVLGLIHQGIKGIAIDAPMSDCPLYIAKYSPQKRSNLAEAVKIVTERGKSQGFDLEKKQPVHIETLSRFKILVESLDIPHFVENWYPHKQQCFETKILLTSLNYYLLPDALPVKILVKKYDNV